MTQANGYPTIQVERGIPVPRKTSRGPKCRRYPWDRMRVGDSFFLPCSADDLVKVQNSVSSAAWAWGRKHGGLFMTRKVEGGLRVWRRRGDSD